MKASPVLCLGVQRPFWGQRGQQLLEPRPPSCSQSYGDKPTVSSQCSPRSRPHEAWLSQEQAPAAPKRFPRSPGSLQGAGPCWWLWGWRSCSATSSSPCHRAPARGRKAGAEGPSCSNQGVGSASRARAPRGAAAAGGCGHIRSVVHLRSACTFGTASVPTPQP